MGWIRDITQCQRCGYKAAQEEKHICSWYRSIICVRCGYSSERFFNHKKYDSLKKGYSGKDEDEEFKAQCWEWDVIYPTGSYIYRCKGEEMFTVGSIEDGSIENIIEHLDKYDVCKYTFYKARFWYIKDLHSNTTTLFLEDEYRKCRLI